ncbi:myosin-14-like isoform X1 [Lactuca sativa]|uniref:myosin-14-like isoform X1 n=1 Tax=Lactuca sativa TaxID=4236 RepID=UPI0022AF0FD5|nr:myosin-14-like isoform X1 [Lactuca sativa]
MSSSQVNLKNYLIPLEEIKRATENFSQQRCIGGGGFGLVYKGQLSERWQNFIVAIKRLGPDSYQGEHEFRNEVEMISMFHHENIISFIGYCDEEHEMIIVYKYAVHGSLDRHLEDPNKMCHITWTQRLMICRGAARGLDYLHSGLGEHKRVIHRDVKSANVLLDDNFVAKVCDFGLSKFGARNLPNTEVFTKVAGTQFYVDPTYNESRILRKESDVYSFGVVMFEMLSGMLVYSERSIEDDRTEFLMNLVRRYDHNVVDKLIDPHMRDQIDSHSLDMFKEIAYQCISLNFTKRPTMDKVTERIQEALTIQDNVDTLILCATKYMGFSYGKPVAAFTIYKCLLHWKYLEAGRTSVVDRLLKLIDSAIKDQDNYDVMAYWLSNASNLLFLIYSGIKPDVSSIVSNGGGQTSLFRRITRGMTEVVVGAVDAIGSAAEAVTRADVTSRHDAFVEQQLLRVEARNRALVFMQQLTVYVEILYCIIRNNLKNELGSLPTLCTQGPITSRELLIGNDSTFNHWQYIVDRLNTLLIKMKENFVPSIIVQKIFAQVFTYINVQLFNSLLSRPECCTFSNGEYMKVGLATLEIWCFHGKPEYAGSAWDELKHIRQATRFLTTPRKDKISYTKLTKDICPILNVHQLYRICTIFSTPMSKTQHVSQDVISSLRRLMTKDSKDSNSNPFLLDDDLSMPVFVDELSTSLQVKDFANVKPAQELAKYPAFQFLYN